MVYHFTPFFKGDISEGINRSIASAPEDAWICVRDADTMFLTWRQQWQLEKISQATDYGLIGCMTNRCYPTYCMYDGKLSNDYDILHHIEIAKRLETEHWCEVEPCPDGTNGSDEGIIYGQFMMFPKKVWRAAGGFSGHKDHDIGFSRGVVNAGYKRGIAKGVYIFHSFRPGLSQPWLSGKFLNHHALDDLTPKSR